MEWIGFIVLLVLGVKAIIAGGAGVIFIAGISDRMGGEFWFCVVLAFVGVALMWAAFAYAPFSITVNT